MLSVRLPRARPLPGIAARSLKTVRADFLQGCLPMHEYPYAGDHHNPGDGSEVVAAVAYNAPSWVIRPPISTRSGLSCSTSPPMGLRWLWTAYERLELLAGKRARAVCAVRRIVVSLLEAGGTKEVFLGYQSTWRGNSKGTKQTEQALPARSVVGQGTRTTRSLCVKLNCLNPNPDRVNVRTHR